MKRIDESQATSAHGNNLHDKHEAKTTEDSASKAKHPLKLVVSKKTKKTKLGFKLSALPPFLSAYCDVELFEELTAEKDKN